MLQTKRVLIKDLTDKSVRIGKSTTFGSSRSGIHLFDCTAEQDLFIVGRYKITDVRNNLVGIAREIEEVHVIWERN